MMAYRVRFTQPVAFLFFECSSAVAKKKPPGVKTGRPLDASSRACNTARCFSPLLARQARGFNEEFTTRV
jgi:hypothetical protein